eukprot:TRINITY_DN759_c1_g1_i1.p1 TRINITY_DN759_c1_g1~~TRINITY_DN759_c1_g1_i1.p1  ORF type:complete len:192 (-),score=78.67 TRINITY_DN759_c1_g1_i1:927-1502(-)
MPATVHHPKALVPVAHGSEEIETVTIVDTLVRAGVNVTIASVADINQVKCSRGVEIVASCNIRDCVERDWDAVVLPGGMPGAEHLYQNPTLQHILKDQHQAGKLIGAICAAPAVVLAPLGILEGRIATCYPTDKFTSALPKYDAKESLLVVEDGHIVTSKGPGTSLAFALRLAGRLMGDETEARLAHEMLA